MQIFSQQQDAWVEFRRVTNATLDRMERNQNDFHQRMETMQQQIFEMQRQIFQMQRQIFEMQQNITGLQTENRRILDEIRRQNE